MMFVREHDIRGWLTYTTKKVKKAAANIEITSVKLVIMGKIK